MGSGYYPETKVVNIDAATGGYIWNPDVNYRRNLIRLDVTVNELQSSDNGQSLKIGCGADADSPNWITITMAGRWQMMDEQCGIPGEWGSGVYVAATGDAVNASISIGTAADAAKITS